MKVCAHCGRESEPREDGTCPLCQEPATSPSEPTVVRKTPAVSAMASGDADLLRRGVMRPPSRLGTSGKMGRFEIVKPIGQGGMGHVFQATEPVTDTPVALKLLKRELAEDERIARAFLGEARCMYQLSHPGILKVLEVSAPEDGPFFVMPLVTGGSLDRRLRDEGRLGNDEALELGIQVAEALAYAHRKGLIHRDLKPANVLLGEDGRALVTDFGLVRSFSAASAEDLQGETPEGTPAYMSPSVAAGEAEDTRCDIYALGALMYEMLTGRPPYEGQSVQQVLEAVRRGPPVALANVNPAASRELVAVTEWCMARALRDRYATMDDVLADLKRVSRGQVPVGPHGRGVVGRRPVARMAIIAAGVVVAAALCGVGLHAVRGFQLRGNSAEAQCRRADALQASGELDAAAAVYGEVLAATPEHARALYGMGRVELARGTHRPATEYLLRAQRAAPADAEIAKALVGTMLDSGHAGPARRALEIWLEADPGNEEALALRTKLPPEDLPLRRREGLEPPRRDGPGRLLPPRRGRPGGRPFRDEPPEPRPEPF